MHVARTPTDKYIIGLFRIHHSRLASRSLGHALYIAVCIPRLSLRDGDTVGPASLVYSVMMLRDVLYDFGASRLQKQI